MIYHLAAVVGVEHYVGDPYETLNVNVNGTQNILKAAYKHRRSLVFSSTSEVYGRNPKVPWKEDDDRVLGATTIDRWCYSTSRQSANILFRLSQARDAGDGGALLQHLWAAAGPGRRRPPVHDLHGPVVRGADLTVIGDGEQTRCFTYVTDAVAATVAAGINPAADGQAINIGADVETTVLEFADLMIELYGSAKSKIKFVTQADVYGQSYEDIPRRVPDNTRMRTLLGVDAEGDAARGHGALDGLVSARAGRLIPARSA